LSGAKKIRSIYKTGRGYKITVLDKYLEKTPTEQQNLIRDLDNLILNAAPQLTASLKWGHLTYHHTKNVCSLISHKQYLNLQLWAGAALNDPRHLLTGKGKQMRHIQIKTAADIDHDYIKQLVRQAAGC